MSSDKDAIERYEQLLRTAPPDSLQKVHGEAFAKLTPAQRELIYQKLVARAEADDERPVNSNAYALAATATLVERRKPGTLKRLFDEADADPAWGQTGRSFYGTFAGVTMATAITFGLLVSYDPGAVLSGEGDPGANPGGLFTDFGTDFVGY
jgi:hypothetical protein